MTTQSWKLLQTVLQKPYGAGCRRAREGKVGKQLDQLNTHLGTGKSFYTRSRGVKFRAWVKGDSLFVESERSGRTSYSESQVAAARVALGGGVAPTDRGAQVAKSWVDSIDATIAGEPIPAKAKKRAVRKSAAKPTKSKKPGARAAKRAKPVKRRALTTSVLRRELAKVLKQGSVPAAKGQEFVERFEEERAALVEKLKEVEARATSVEAINKRLAQAVLTVQGAGRIGIFNPIDEGESNAYPEEVRFNLAESARLWGTSPNGAISSARTALDATIRAVYLRIGGVEVRGLQFGAMADFLNDRGSVRGNLDPEDIFIAKHLFRRASSFAHARAIKATKLEAALIWSGVAMISEHAFRKAGIGR
jgi:hypothetical protein